MPKPAHRAHDLLDVLVRAEDNAPWCSELARQATHSLGGALNGVPADVLSGAVDKLETLCDKKVDVGLVSLQIGQYAALGGALGNMTALTAEVCAHQFRGDAARDSLVEKLKAYTAAHTAAKDLHEHASRHKAHLEAMLKCAKQIEKTCAERTKAIKNLIKAAEALNMGVVEAKAPPEEDDEALARLSEAGLHFILVEDITEATRVHAIMATVKDKPDAMPFNPRRGCFMVDGDLVIYVSESGGAFYVLVKDKVKDTARLAKDLMKAGLPKDWVFTTAGDSRLPKKVDPLAFERVGYYDGTKKKARVEEEEEDESEED